MKRINYILAIVIGLPLLSIASIGDTIHAMHYSITINEINTTTQTIDASTLITLKPLVNDLDAIRLELLDLTVTSVDVDGTPVTNFSHDNGFLEIPLPVSVDTTDILNVEIAYNGQPFHESWGGFHFSGSYGFNLGVGISYIPHNLGKAWFPCIDDFTDRATYELFVTVDEGLTAVCGGILVETTIPSPGKIMYHWELNQPVPTYLVSVAVGDYVLIEETYNGLERDIPVTYYVKPVDSVKVAGNFANLNDIMMIYETHFGPYSWDRMGYVGTQLGAMEHATNVAYPNNTITGNATYEWLYAHEMSHMWFGDKVTCDKAEEMWLNEGWAVFCEMFYTEILYNVETFKTTLMDKHADVLQYVHEEEGGYWPLNNLPQTITYGTSAYDKGSTVVQTLRNYLGDELFFETMTAFLDHFAFTSVNSYDMRDFITDHTGINMTGFFDNWVLNGGTPHYSLDSFNIQPAETGSEISLYLKAKRKGPSWNGTLHKTDIYFMDSDWNWSMDTVIFSGETGMSVKSLPFEPVAVFVDLESNICDAKTGGFTVVNQPGDIIFDHTFFQLSTQEITDSAFVRVIHHWVAPDSLKAPVPNLRISDYRYWSVEGVFPDDFVATGRFQYNKSGYLDNTLILSETDSIIILYRKDAAHDWENISFTRIGPWSIGFLYVDSLKIGEYTLAVIDISVGENENELPPDDKSWMHIFPNPSGNRFHI
ncbi:MAG: M1 family metallopeptidase, partial [Bacteroidetes bacterium]|nr:M1 family metallopeptidase [Bacteroidota bacterium]